MKLGLSVAAATLLLGVAACDVNVDNGNTVKTADNSAEKNSSVAETAGSADGSKPNPQSVARAQELAKLSGSEASRAQMRQQAMSESGDLRFVVDISDRKLRIYRGDKEIRSHAVAVGTDKNPTPKGEFQFHRVDLNPEWNPPDSDWAEDREKKEPGASDNPMGRARLVYKMPYTIHGTDSLDSLGKAVSHGSIRVANENVIELAELLLKAGGAWEGDKWFKQMAQNRDKEYQIELQQPIPLKNQE